MYNPFLAITVRAEILECDCFLLRPYKDHSLRLRRQFYTRDVCASVFLPLAVAVQYLKLNQCGVWYKMLKLKINRQW